MLRALGRAGGKVTPRDPGPLARTVASTATQTRKDAAAALIGKFSGGGARLHLCRRLGGQVQPP